LGDFLPGGKLEDGQAGLELAVGLAFLRREMEKEENISWEEKGGGVEKKACVCDVKVVILLL
jgi:hypothetical protein